MCVKPEEYCQRAVELGHTTVFTTNHGVTGNIFDWLVLSKQYNLKMIYGMEAYYVDDYREKDNSNRHLILIAKNNDGVMQLNDAMSIAHDEGFYYKPRIDRGILMSLDPNNFVITTACVAGIWNDRELMLALHEKFRENFFLEVQAHNIDIQKEVNKELLEFSSVSGIPIIHANDSHYIYPEDSEYRDIFLRGKGRFYENEGDMILDYPDSDEIFNRYKKQGILTASQVEQALENTLIFDDCSEITYINDDVKLPPISDHPKEDLEKLINERWLAEQRNIPKERRKEYIEAIRYEADIIERTHMENYFLIDYHVAKDGQERYGGKLTNTGRGSAPSFYTTKLLGLTDIDRLNSPITLFPTRFMSVERILGARSLPDIDLNTSDKEPFVRATEDLLGKENCAWMLAWKPLQDSSAFRLYCKGIGKDISEYDEVAKDLDNYREDKKWKQVIEESKRFVGVIESVSESPCSMLLYNKPVRRELGLVRTSKGKMCCLLDGYNCDKFKYLKNDYLTVTVWAIIRDVCKLSGIPIPTIRELDSMLDDKTFDIYKEGLTCTINQADSDFATELAKTYCPHSVSEMSSFVAIIRPGCASLLQDFIHRKPYTTGVKELDDLLVEGSHRMLYQELIMKYLIWLGIPETGSYDIIKKIAKKKFKEAELEDLKAKLKDGWVQRVGTEDGFIKTWTVVEQAAKYSFNASHSLSYAYDSLYGAYLKSHYPLEYYTVALNYYADDSERTLKLTNELSYFGISLNTIKFQHSKGDYALDRETNSIYKGIASIKYMNSEVADQLFELGNKTYISFTNLLENIAAYTTINSKQLRILAELDFFSEFGDANKLLSVIELFEALHGKKNISKEKIPKLGIDQDVIRRYAAKETEKMYTGVNVDGLVSGMEGLIKYRPRTLADKIASQQEHLGYIDIKDDKYSGFGVVMSVDTKYSPKLKIYSLKNGTTVECKIQKQVFNKQKLKEGQIVRIMEQKRKPKLRRTDDGRFEPVSGTFDIWIEKYKVVDNL